MIIDTDVLIWLMRQNANAISLVASIQQREIAQATWLELVEGVRSKRELAKVKSLRKVSVKELRFLWKNTR